MTKFDVACYAAPAFNARQEWGRLEGLREKIFALAHNAATSRSSFLRAMQDQRRSLEDECGFPAAAPDPEYYWDLYDKVAVAARVVEVWPSESWKVCPEVYEAEAEDERTPFEAAWDELARSLQPEPGHLRDPGRWGIWDYLYRADVLCGVGQYAIILLGLNDGKRLDEPAAWAVETGSRPLETVSADNETPPDSAPAYDAPVPYQLAYNAAGDGEDRKLLYVRVFPEVLAPVAAVEGNPASPRFGRPVAYNVTFHDPREYGSSLAGVGMTTVTKTVHWTRVVHVADNLEASDVFGKPRLRPVLEHVLSLRKVYASSGEGYYKGAFPGVSVETHPSLGGDVPLDLDALRDMIEEYQNGLQRYLALSGLSAKTLAPNVLAPGDFVDPHLAAICLKLGIPLRILVGSERGELSSEQDSEEWDDRLRARRRRQVTTHVIAPFVNRLVNLGVLPVPDGAGEADEPGDDATPGYSVDWPDGIEKNASDQSTVALNLTKAVVTYLGGAGQHIVAPFEFLTIFLGFSGREAQLMIDKSAPFRELAAKAAAAGGLVGSQPGQGAGDILNPAQPVKPSQDGKLKGSKDGLGMPLLPLTDLPEEGDD